jgi:hypothetical protein
VSGDTFPGVGRLPLEAACRSAKRAFRKALKSGSGRRLFLELFAGVGFWMKQVKKQGFPALAMDIKAGAQLDLLNPGVVSVVT